MSVRRLPPGLQQIAEDELNEISDRVQEDLQHIKDWLAKQQHIKARTDDQWLLTFLRSCKFSLQRTKEKLDLFYTMRSLMPEYFRNRDPFLPEIQAALKLGAVAVLPKTIESAGPRIAIIRPGNTNPDVISITLAIKVLLMITDVLLFEDDNFSVGGQQVIIDLKDLSYKTVTQINPMLMKKWTVLLQDAYPTRGKALHYINTPSFLETMFALLRTMVSEKNKNKIYFHHDVNEVYKSIPLSILPSEYGGQGGTMSKLTAELKLKIESYRDWFLEDEQYCSNEAKRPGKPKTSADMFGIEGSFRKLDID